MTELTPQVWIDVVGLTPRLLEHAPNIAALAELGSCRPIEGVLPAVTCSAQATALTGLAPSGHGIVGNGWFHRETGEIRFWLQSNQLIQGETIYAAGRRLARDKGATFSCAKMFWWFNQGAPVDYAVTPKPWYGSDGSKEFGIHGAPEGLPHALERELGAFPFHTFWGPKSGIESSEWIARAAAKVMLDKRPTLTLVYLPHLDYDLQRFGPNGDSVPAQVAAVDLAAKTVIDAARQIGAQVTVFSEYGLYEVRAAELPNRLLRAAGMLKVREGPFGETLDTFASRAFAVCDHQIAHVYVPDANDRRSVARLFEKREGVARVLDRDERIAMGIEHPRSGDLVLLARGDRWFAYPYWLSDRFAPDFAKTVDIHRKPGYDPLELFIDPTIKAPTMRVATRLAQKKLGMRYRMDVVPLDTSLVKGSHGLLPMDPQEGPVLVADDAEAGNHVQSLADLKEYTLARMGLLD